MSIGQFKRQYKWKGNKGVTIDVFLLNSDS